MWVLNILFSRFRCARRIIGGKWELWWVDFPVVSHVWHDVDEFFRNTSDPPSPLCRCHPIKEEEWSC